MSWPACAINRFGLDGDLTPFLRSQTLERLERTFRDHSNTIEFRIRRLMNRLIYHTIFATMAMLLAPSFAQGEANVPAIQSTAFRVKTTLFAGKDEEPAAEHLILFSDSLVYDLPQINDNVVTVFDPGRGRVVLLDRATQVKSTIATDDLVKLTAQLRTSADNAKKRKQLGLDAEIQPIIVDPKTGEAAPVELNESSEKIASDGYMTKFGEARYEVLTQTPRQPAVAVQYGQFADLALRLNVIRPLGLPPFPRMSLNDRVTASGQIPLETRLTIRRALTSDRYRSTHVLVELLSESDRRSINEIGGMLALYKEVPLDQFPE